MTRALSALREQAEHEAKVCAEANEQRIDDDDVVEFEGESVKWSELTVQDRKAYLNGGYAF